MAVTAQQLTQLYLAYFGRPPDFDGMIYYTTQSNLTLQQVAANFSASPESQALYGSTSLAGVIDAIYMNLFNRHAEVGGLTYWSTQIASGAISPAFAAYAILIGAQNDDKIAVQNKMQVATDWLAHLDTQAEITGYSGNTAAASARAFLATVDSTTASLTTAETNLDAAIFNTVNNVDNNPLAITISAPTVVEGNTGTKQLAFVVTLNHASASAVTVSYTTGGGTATAGDDYEATAGSITFQPGQTTAVVNVTVDGDITVEDNETVGLTVTGTQISNSGVSGMGTITNDDITPLLTTGQDTITVAGTGPNTIKGVVDGGTPANSTFSVGDTIHGNGQTTVELVVSVAGTGAFANMDNIAAVNVVAGVAGTINFNALEWTNVGSINLASGISGANLQLASVGDAVDLGIGASVAGTIAASYQDGLFVSMANGGKGGASYEASAGDLTIHLNGAGKSATAIIANTADAVTAGNIVIDGGADNAAAHVTVNAAGDVTVGDVTLSVGDSGLDQVVLGASGDLTVGAVALAGGDSATASFTASATGDISIASIAENVGASGSALVAVTAVSGGDVTVGGVAQIGGFVSANIATTGSGDVTVGDVMQTASTSAAVLYVSTGVGSIAVGDIHQTVGDSATALASLSVTSAATGVTSVASITVGTVTQVGGDGATAVFDLYGATGTTTSAAAIGGDVTVGGIHQTVGDSGSASVSITAQAGGVVTVGDVSQAGGDSADVHAFISSTADVTIGDVTLSIGNASATTTSHTARFQAQASGDLTVGNVSVSAGDGQNVNAWATVTNSNGHDLTVGDVTISVGDQTNTDAPYGYFGAFNTSATGDLTVGNVSMNLGLTATGSITISQTNATSSDGGSLTVGDVNLALADKAVIEVDIDNYANVFTSTSHTTMNAMGALTVGDINAALGTNAVASVSVTQSMTGTNGGAVGELTVGDINISSDIDSYANVYLHAANYAGGDLDGVTVGNVDISMDDGGSFTFQMSVTDTSGTIDHVTVGDVSLTVGVSGSVNSFSIDVVGGAVGDVTIGDLAVVVGEQAFANTITVQVSATTGDIGTITLGDLDTTVAQGGRVDAHWVNVDAAGDIGDITIGDVNVTLGKSGSMEANWVTISAAGDIGSVAVGDVTISVGQSASVTDTALWVGVFGAGDVGSVTVGDVDITVAKNGAVSTGLYVSVTGTAVDSVVIGDETVTLGASATAGTGHVVVSATSDIGSVSIGDLTYKVGAGATAGVLNYTAVAGAGIGSFTVGDVDLQGTVTAMYNVTAGTDDIGAVTFGDISVKTSALASIDINGGANKIGTLVFGDLSAATADIVINASGGDIGAVTIGDLAASAVATTAAAQVFVDVVGTGTLGDLHMGNVDVNVVSGSALVTVSMNVGTASGDLMIGDINMVVSATTTTAAPTGGFGEFALNFGAGSLTGDLSVGKVTFDGLAGNTLDVELTTGIAGDVHIGAIDVKGTGSFGGGEYVMNVGGADVTVDLIKVEGGAASNDLASILSGFAQTGTLTLGTVDYSLFTGGAAAIDVSPYSGDITVIGSAAGDTITTNLGSDTLTGGNGTDTFVISDQSQNLTTLAGFHAGNVVTITDFKAGASFGETVATNADQFDVAHYSEKTAASADAAFTLALSTMSDPTQQSDIVAVQVGTDVYVFVDTDGGNNVDEVIKLTGVNTNVLNFADFAS